MYKVAELFAGIGGIGLGFKKAGFELVWANELDSKACITYQANFKHPIVNADMTTVDPHSFGDIDVLTGGFPCQAFSIAGYRKGFNDARGNIFFDILRFIEAKNPRVVFLENVKNLTTHDHGKTFKIIQEALKDHGYFLKFKVLNTCEISDIPQNRERIYLIGFKDKSAYDRFEFPTPTQQLKPIASLLEQDVDESFYYDNNPKIGLLKQEITDPQAIYQWRRVYVRKNQSGVCPTLTANMGTGGHNVPLILQQGRIRKLTPRECARFQGYPDSFVLPSTLAKSALYKQIGNSVSVPVIQKLAKNILTALEN